MTRRPAHKTGHAPCPFGQLNWSDCDAASAHRWGRCKAMVGDREPSPCSRWAQDDDGWCIQHYVSLHDEVTRKAREAERQLQLNERIDAFLAKAADPDYKWWVGLAGSADSTRGLPGVEPGGSSPQRRDLSVGGRAQRKPTMVRKPPHRLTELA